MKPEIRNLEKRVDAISVRDSIEFPGTEFKELPLMESVWLELRRKLIMKQSETDVEAPLTIEERQLIYRKRLIGFFNRPVSVVDEVEKGKSWLDD